MLTNCLAECAHLTITVSQIERDIGLKSSFFSYTPLHSTLPLGGFPSEYHHPGMEKLEWCGYPMVKKFRRYLYSFWHNSRTWQTDRQTDGQTDTACRHTALMHMHRAVKTIQRLNSHEKLATPGVTGRSILRSTSLTGVKRQGFWGRKIEGAYRVRRRPLGPHLPVLVCLLVSHQRNEHGQ